MKITRQQLITVFLLLPYLLCTVATAQSTNRTQRSKGDRASIRDPFWPVGYTPVPESKKLEQAKISRLESLIKWPKLKLQGISRTSDNKYLAVIDKIGIVEEGDVIAVKKDGIIYRWKINKITKNGISRTKLNPKEISPPLHTK